jgi:hypothetical protein
MNKSKIATILAAMSHGVSMNEIREVGYSISTPAKQTFAGLSKNSPSHAQQKRAAKAKKRKQ